jgi:hypothetical protein
MFRTVPLYIIKNYSLYTQQWYMSYRFVESFRAGSGWNSSILILLESCLQTCVTYTISECTVSNSWRWAEELPKTCRVTFQNKFDKFVHLVGFITRIFTLMLLERHSYTQNSIRFSFIYFATQFCYKKNLHHNL